MAFVIDASVALSWYFTDETSSIGELAFERLRGSEAVAPIPWWFESHNALLASERRWRAASAQTTAILISVSALPIPLDATERGERSWPSPASTGSRSTMPPISSLRFG